MKNIIICGIAILFFLISCQEDPNEKTASNIIGTWKLLTGTIIEKGDTMVTDYTKDRSFIKIINDSHFAFTLHDLNKGKDSATAAFSAGSGKYSFDGKNYTEHLEYCSAREWEGHDFAFTVIITGDTLLQSGVEKIESEGINRINIEKYIRVKN
jgi:hypothetical protein